MGHDPIRMGAVLLGLAVSASGAVAQTPAPEEFGTADESVTILSCRSFQSEDGGVGTGQDLRWSTDGGWLSAPLDFLPNGIRITRITYYFTDIDPNANLEFMFCMSRFDADSGAQLANACVIEGNTAGVDGDSYIVVATNRDILYRRDLDGNGTTDIETYDLRAHTPSASFHTAIRAVEVRWKRRVSSAPQAATFNDVPTNHLFFQFVEALADSGITAGCGGGNYCPDQPLTRGQMAVFLAKALGLHWPWNAH
jgi:S-layer homology domain